MIKKAISEAIKSQSWAAIEYENKDKEKTRYWIAINDIDIDKKVFFVDAFNFTKMNEKCDGVIEAKIYFDCIKSASLVHNTKYDQPQELIEKIESNIDKLSWLSYDTYRENVLDYIRDCMISEEAPYQKETALVRNIDQDTFENLNNGLKYKLSLEQIADLVPKLERLSKNREKNICEVVTLILNILSISTKRGLFVVAYKELVFDPKDSSLKVIPEIKFNYTFASQDSDIYKHHLKNYLDVDTDYFLDLFVKDQAQAKELLQEEVFKHKEALDDRPYIMDMVVRYYSHIEREIDSIKLRKKEKTLSTPLKAFFGNMTDAYQKGRTRNVDVVLIDDKVNIDQLRVVYNALTKPITYVQGPPGTGKTQTIINVLISAFFNDDKVLVSSNNNKPINDIYDKFLNFKNKKGKMFLPFIRLGNKEETIKSLEYVKQVLDNIKKHNIDEEKLEKYKDKSSTDVALINKVLSEYENKIELIEQLDTLKSMQANLKLDLRRVVIDNLINKKEEELKKIGSIEEDNISKYLNKIDDRFLSWLFFTGVKKYKKILEPKNNQLLRILEIEDQEEKIKEFNSYIKEDANFNNFQNIFPIILTTNQSSHRLGIQDESFDLVIIDEAGQSSIGYALFTIARGKRLLLVGDQNQLKPVINIALENNKALMKKYGIGDSYSYLDNSILLTMQKVDTISKFVLLRYHYRSHKDIINFSNAKYYSNQLKLLFDDRYIDNALEYIDVTSTADSNFERNISIVEINAIVNDLKEKKHQNVGVITPFRNQAKMLKEVLKEEGLDYVNVGTIHTFQGDEKDVIYLSTALTNNTFDKTFDWVKNNQELLNVATTRAKKKFVFVGDRKKIESKSADKNDLFELMNYVITNGKEVTLTPTSTSYFINGANFKNYDTEKEKEFFDSINHLLTTADKYELKEKVGIKTFITKFKDESSLKFGLMGECDLVIFKKINKIQIPVVVIELDGPEHKEDPKVIKRDKMKQEIFDYNNIRLIRIDNKYSRRYMYIKDLLKNILK